MPALGPPHPRRRVMMSSSPLTLPLRLVSLTALDESVLRHWDSAADQGGFVRKGPKLPLYPDICPCLPHDHAQVNLMDLPL